MKAEHITDRALPITDKVAIGLSMLCAVHCLALPLLIVMLPTMAALPLNNEAFHEWLVLIVVPTSLFALTMGCKRHKRYRLLALGATGVLLLIAAILVESYLGEFYEKAMTLIGASLIAFGHYQNYRLCQTHQAQHQEACACAE